MTILIHYNPLTNFLSFYKIWQGFIAIFLFQLCCPPPPCLTGVISVLPCPIIIKLIMIYLERAVFPCRIQYYLSDICTLMLPLCFQFSALTRHYLYCHLFRSPGKGKINLALCVFWSSEWEPICLKSQILLSLLKCDSNFICQPDVRTNIQ